MPFKIWLYKLKLIHDFYQSFTQQRKSKQPILHSLLLPCSRLAKLPLPSRQPPRTTAPMPPSSTGQPLAQSHQPTSTTSPQPTATLELLPVALAMLLAASHL